MLVRFAFVFASLIFINQANAATQALDSSPKSYTCRLVTGYGTAIGKGSSKLAAKEQAMEICGTKLIDQYFAQRGNVSDDVTDDLALACVNLDCE